MTDTQNTFTVGQLLITERHVGIFIEEFDDVAEYPKGEVFEILEVIENDNHISYRIDFGIDDGQKDYIFDEDTIKSFLREEEV